VLSPAPSAVASADFSPSGPPFSSFFSVYQKEYTRSNYCGKTKGG